MLATLLDPDRLLPPVETERSQKSTPRFGGEEAVDFLAIRLGIGDRLTATWANVMS